MVISQDDVGNQTIFHHLDRFGARCGEQLKVIKESEIVVKLTASEPKSMSAEYGIEVRDLVAFYHWYFMDARGSTTIAIRSYSNIRTDKRPSEGIITDLQAAFHRSWDKCLKNLAALVLRQ
jgi:hypothetical protein